MQQKLSGIFNDVSEIQNSRLPEQYLCETVLNLFLADNLGSYPGLDIKFPYPVVLGGSKFEKLLAPKMLLAENCTGI